MPGDLGFVMEPLLGHTLVLGTARSDLDAHGPPEDDATTLAATGVDHGVRRAPYVTLYVWGGKAQYPPVNDFGFREREHCVATYCTGAELEYTITDRMWRWAPLAGWGFGFGYCPVRH